MSNDLPKLPKLLTKSDMATRWGIARNAVKNREDRHDDFPPVATRVDNGRLPLYLEVDVEAYEARRGYNPKKIVE
ncbi:hypothetical protein MM326_13725 [Alkalihalobacillus sp. LMS6]|uniref:hypothetical protein n=1 Tax=Alkalihalobacillus sp. LMS6 TaxID=2924034 RepID=UPI0020D16418|nr:hypothetical protein [Alkalihalobacillus sp. LMS6]UTR05167.1 hypothetical protein MM326_13725 [Alkalihalobacillus sp. LMS6]